MIKNNRHRYYTLEDLLYYTDYILNNSFCIFGNIAFKQLNGVPQGGNFSPLLADLTLSVYEYYYSVRVIKQHRNFFPFRYMDDLLIIHNINDNDIHETLQMVYNNILQLETTNFTEHHCNYLDLDIKIINNKIITKIFNKTDNFKFNVIRFPHFQSNISIKIKGSVIYTEVLRIARTCTLITDFKENIRNLKLLLYRNEFPEDVITKNILKCIYRNRFIVLKYNLHRSLKGLIDFIKLII